MEPAEVLTESMGQAVHAVSPADDPKLPGAQGVHTLVPYPAVYEPAAHRLHALACGAPPYVPGPQVMQLDIPGLL